MTEQEWLAGGDFWPMLEFMRRKASDRKWRLFAVACCRHIWDWFGDQRSKRAVEMAERFADGQCSADELAAAYTAAQLVPDPQAEDPAWAPVSAALPCSSEEDEYAPRTYGTVGFYAAFESVNTAFLFPHKPLPLPRFLQEEERAEESREYANLLRDIFNNPFRPVAFDAAWRSPRVTAVAQTIYAERRFADLPILADALEEAGCTCAEILDHCRNGGEHVRGCWALDLALGQS